MMHDDNAPFACVDFDGTCRGRIVFDELDEFGLSYPRCHRHNLVHRVKKKQELKTL